MATCNNIAFITYNNSIFTSCNTRCNKVCIPHIMQFYFNWAFKLDNYLKKSTPTSSDASFICVRRQQFAASFVFYVTFGKSATNTARVSLKRYNLTAAGQCITTPYDVIHWGCVVSLWRNNRSSCSESMFTWFIQRINSDYLASL